MSSGAEHPDFASHAQNEATALKARLRPWRTPVVIHQTVKDDTASDSNPASDNANGFGTHS